MDLNFSSGLTLDYLHLHWHKSESEFSHLYSESNHMHFKLQ